MEELKELLPSLEKANRLIDFQGIVLWLNQNDVDYEGWRDLEMIIYYLKNNEDNE